MCKILDQEEMKPHKVRYYLEQRDPDFAEKMAEVLCVYRQVKILKQAAAAAKKKRLSDAVAIISYDEKPGIQAIATTAPDLLRPNRAPMRPSHVSMNISATARSACWPASTSSPNIVDADQLASGRLALRFLQQRVELGNAGGRAGRERAG